MGRDERDAVAEPAAKAPRLAKRAADIAGKIWNSPNTALGLIAGGVGYVVGQANRLRPGKQPVPRVQIGHNAVEFINNPVSPLGGLTLGNVTLYGDDPYDASDEGWAQAIGAERIETVRGLGYRLICPAGEAEAGAAQT